MIDEATLKTIEARMAGTKSASELQALRVKYLGRRGEVTEWLKSIGSLEPKARAKAGQDANRAKARLERALAKAEQSILALGQSALSPIDLTVPVAPNNRLGHLHPVSQLLQDWVRIFWQMGYEVVDGPEIETEWYNFEALLVGADHPARDMQDTFYLSEGNLPRTQTSNVQVRYMEQHQPPIRIISPGKVFRNEDEDARHLWMFYQVEGLVVDKGVTVSDLKGTLLAMMKGLLGDEVDIRLRPSYFPYTEPSLELDVTCIICAGQGCKTCSGTGWLEIGGSGMVHPQVLANVGIDPEVYSGFAFGFGPERIAMIKYGLPDIREFWRPNLKFLEQF